MTNKEIIAKLLAEDWGLSDPELIDRGWEAGGLPEGHPKQIVVIGALLASQVEIAFRTMDNATASYAVAMYIIWLYETSVDVDVTADES
jgi:hypothetical protein